MKLNKKQGGFTLVELMITVAIIGILAAFAVPAYINYQIRAQLSEGMVISEGMKAAVQEYYAMNGSLPADQTDLNIALAQGKYSRVSSVHNGIVIVSYDLPATNKQVGSYTLGLEAVPTASGGIYWKCGPYSSNNASYFPSSCRDDLDRNGYGR